jgi:hypothetical protein
MVSSCNRAFSVFTSMFVIVTSIWSCKVSFVNMGGYCAGHSLVYVGMFRSGLLSSEIGQKSHHNVCLFATYILTANL